MVNVTLQHKAIEVVPYSEEFKEKWDHFVEHRALNSTFLHSRRFYDHNPLNSLDDASLMFFENNRMIAVFPAVLHQVNGIVVLHSHLRATYGGFLLSRQVGVEKAIRIVGQTIAFAREKGARQIIVRNPFRIYHTRLCDETDYAMWYHGFSIKSREIETAVQLTGDMRSIRSQYHKGTKYSLGKSRNNVTVRLSDDFRGFWTLLENCLLERHGIRPVHDYEAICRLREKVGADKVMLFSAFYKDRLIGGNVVFNFRNVVLHGQYNASDHEFQHLGPLHAVVDYILEWSLSRGFKYFNMGTSNLCNGTQINPGLFYYKEGFGGRGFLRETMFLDL